MIITSMLFRPFAGFLIDRLGRRITIAVSLCVTALISLAYLLPTNIMGLILLRGLMGLPFAMNTAGVATLRTDLIPENKKVEGFSVTTVTIMLSALVIGPNLGFLVLNIRGFSLLFPIAAGLLITAVGNLLLLKFHDIRAATNQFAAREIFEPRAFWFALIMGILFIGWPGVLTYSPLYSLEVGLSFGGFFFLAFGTGLILSQFIAKIILNEARSKTFTAFAILLVVTGHGIIGLIRNQTGFLLGAVFIGAGYGLSFSIFTKLAFDLVVPERRGRCSGTLYIVEDLGATIGIYAYSFIAEATGTFANAYLMAAGISAVSLTLLLLIALPDYQKRIKLILEEQQITT
jgi:MFS family permease